MILRKITEWIKEQQGKHFCKCGCGSEITIQKHHKSVGIPNYIHNHHIRGENNPMKRPEVVKLVIANGGGFQKGHGLLRGPHTEEENKSIGAKNSINMKNWYKNHPNSKSGYQKGHKAYYHGKKAEEKTKKEISISLKNFFKMNPKHLNFDRNIKCDWCGEILYFKEGYKHFKRCKHYCNSKCEKKGRGKTMFKKYKHNIKPDKMPLCACGCGEEIEWKYWNINLSQPLGKYKQGHGLRVNNPMKSLIAREKMGKSIKRLWKDPEYKKKMSIKLKEKWKDPEYKKNQLIKIGFVKGNIPWNLGIKVPQLTGLNNGRWKGGRKGEYMKKWQREYSNNRYKNDKEFRIKVLLRGQVLKAFNRYTKTKKIKKSKEYGIDYKKIIEYLKPFPIDIENYQLDHVIPLHSFNFIKLDGSTNLKEVKKAFAPENYQWLTNEINLWKRDRLIKPLTDEEKEKLQLKLESNRFIG